ncbi:flavin-binding monooxygenase-like protein-like protein [Tricladium varicosporioides]|nr:flavin-binding monooxygenase-like protein-like protein [Hymenoscyphus varicosporioides]
MNNVKTVDVIVIGAGLSGIYAAKFYLDIHPNSQLIILDKDSCVGGTWNSRRGFDSFWTQWTVGCAEFSDLQMPRPPEEDIYYEFFKAKHTTKYLETYVDHHSYSGKTLRERISLGNEVKAVAKTDKGWTVISKTVATEVENTLHSSKLIIASGLTSIPHMPTLAGDDIFGGPIIHQEAFGSSNILALPIIKNVTVLGGGKSSADMVYAAVKHGKVVTWILQETETTGPGFLFSPKGKGPYKNAFEIGMTRVAGTFTPSFLNGQSLWTWMLHSTKYGAKVMNAFWEGVNEEARKEANFDNRKNLEGFEKLCPHSTIFWQNATGGLLNHEDFFETIAEHVRIICADVVSLGKDTVNLRNTDSVASDAILCGTGWVPSLQFFTEEQLVRFGLPHKRTYDSEEERWKTLEATADAKVTSTFPLLAHPPPHYHKPVHVSPYRLYKHIAPLPLSDDLETHDRSIVFIGQIGVGNYFPVVQCQAMWATAYMDGRIKLPSKKDQEEEVALFIAWCRKRYLSNGEDGLNMTFELIGYIDTVLEALGLSSYRRGYIKDLFSPLTAKDFAGLKDEYISKYGQDELEVKPVS